MRPSLIDISPTTLSEIYRIICERDASGDPITIIRDSGADRHTKVALVPTARVHKSVVCRHVKQLVLTGQVLKVHHEWLYMGGARVEVVQLLPKN